MKTATKATLQDIRKDKGLTLDQVASLVTDITKKPMSVTMMHYLETGQRKMSLKNAAALSEIYNIGLEEMRQLTKNF